MNYFDLHCDTPFELFQNKTHLDSNAHHISLERTENAFSHYAQLAAYCSPSRLDDESCFDGYLKNTEYFFSELESFSDRAMLCGSHAELEAAERCGKAAFFPAVEDARILAGKLERLEILYKNKCRFLTLVWGGSSCIGGAHNTEEGLTNFGKSTVMRCFELGIVPDISHSSERAVDDLIEIADEFQKPFIASHSNSYAVFPHSRNLRDRHFKKLCELGGIVGISLCDMHICPVEAGRPNVDSVIRHIEHYLELGGEESVAFGCDFDGCDLPDGFESISDISKIFDRMSVLGYSDELIEKISYNNARQFIKRNL